MPFNVLWTSGWDSTYRVADLVLTQRQTVQPWYVIDPNRRSTRTEIRTMRVLRDAMIRKDPSAADRLLPPRVFRKEDIPADPEVSAQFSELLRHDYWGAQYEWLARLAKAEDIRLEIGLKADDSPSRRMAEFIVPSGTAGRFALDMARVTGPLSMFRRFDFPIYDVTKKETEALAAAAGFTDVMELTWFCHTPLLNGKPCGFCPPCEHARAEGFERRVPPPTLGRKIQFKAIVKARHLSGKLRGVN